MKMYAYVCEILKGKGMKVEYVNLHSKRVTNPENGLHIVVHEIPNNGAQIQWEEFYNYSTESIDYALSLLWA